MHLTNLVVLVVGVLSIVLLIKFDRGEQKKALVSWVEKKIFRSSYGARGSAENMISFLLAILFLPLVGMTAVSLILLLGLK